VPNARSALGRLSAAFFRHPSRTVRVVGVTGTKGKTTTSWIVHAIFEATGRRAGLFGTILNRIGEEILPSGNTTPGAVEIDSNLRRLADRGGTHAVMEVSSHGIDQGRIANVEFSCGVFTNIAPEHLDYHGSFEKYLQTKIRFFELLPQSATAVLPRGDAVAEEIASRTMARVIWTSREARDGVERVRLDADATSFVWKGIPLRTSIWGDHNLSNLLLAINAAEAVGVDPAAIAHGVERAVAPPGRLEEVPGGTGYKIFVDYAHTDGSLETVLRGLRPVTAGRIILVFGCGGNRDREKRPRMGAVAERLADKVILTSDNPRNEDPGTILDEIAEGMERRFAAAMVTDRKDAIVLALRMAKPGDVVLVAGKGHEAYQEVRGKKYPFHDRKVIEDMLRRLERESAVGRGAR
jgi:UDP-N-acetylmuramoyl-L-alanyl-D-glutamate--2,6-diaminopimelate ligase